MDTDALIEFRDALAYAERELRRRARSARESWDRDAPDSQASAALRGKAAGLQQAADVVASALRGSSVRRRAGTGSNYLDGHAAGVADMSQEVAITKADLRDANDSRAQLLDIAQTLGAAVGRVRLLADTPCPADVAIDGFEADGWDALRARLRAALASVSATDAGFLSLLPPDVQNALSALPPHPSSCPECGAFGTFAHGPGDPVRVFHLRDCSRLGELVEPGGDESNRTTSLRDESSEPEVPSDPTARSDT